MLSTLFACSAVYKIDESMKNKFPIKNTTDVLENEIDYCQKLIDVIEKEDTLTQYPKVKEQLNLLKETVADDIEHLQISEDKDAKVGHKTSDSSFFGYKTHIAMSEERKAELIPKMWNEVQLFLIRPCSYSENPEIFSGLGNRCILI